MAAHAAAFGSLVFGLKSDTENWIANQPALHSVVVKQKKAAKGSTDSLAGICIWLQPFWLAHTRMLRDLKMLDEMFQTSPDLKKACQLYTHAIVDKCCRQGNQKKHARAIAAFVASRNDTECAFATLAFLLMLKYESKDGIYAVVERMAVRVSRCDSAKKQAYTQVVQKGAHVARNPSIKSIRTTKLDTLLSKAHRTCTKTTVGTFPQCAAMKLFSSHTEMSALNRVYEAVEDYLDDHKEKAFKSAMFEPCRFYFDLVENTCHRDHVDTHGLNWFLVMIRGGVGARLPLIPMDHEWDTIGFCDCWAGLNEGKAWSYFADPANFGKSFEGIKALRRGSSYRDRLLRDRSLGG